MYTSIESPDYSYSIVVNKPKSKVEAFSRDKLLITVFDSLKHRKSAYSDAAALTDTVIAKVLNAISGPGVDLKVITTITEQTLRNFDYAAATHYHAYYSENS